MLKVFGENFMLKVIALATSIMIWFYVSAERTPVIVRQVNAEVQLVGATPENAVVRLRTLTVPVEVTGPRSEVESISENDVKAIVNQRSARPGLSQLPILRYEAPPSAQHVTFRELRHYVSVEVNEKQSKQLPINPFYNNVAPVGRRYGSVKLEPAMAWVFGTREDIQRVDRLVVNIETHGGSVREDLPVQAVDKDGVIVESVKVDPDKTHVELNLVEAPATRTLLVSVPFTGLAPPPYRLTALAPEPAQVTVSGRPELLAQLSSVTTSPIDVSGLTADAVREVPLELPPGVTAQGVRTIRVLVKIHEIGRTIP